MEPPRQRIPVSKKSRILLRAEHSIELAKMVWSSWQASLLLWAAAACSCLWFWWHPSTGAAIAVLGAVAAIMSIREIGPREKFMWLLVVFGLLSVELRSIKKDDETRKQAASDEAAHFKDIAGGLSQTITNTALLITNNQQAFQTTLQRMEDLSKLSRENVEAVTGGDGFVYLDIVKIPVDKDGMSLIAIVHGANTIRDVTYALTEGRPPYIPSETEMNNILAGRGTFASIGNMGPNPRFIGRVLRPSIKDGGYYNINLFALNGAVNETIEVRHETDGTWNRKITVTRTDKLIFASDWYPTRHSSQ